MKPQRQTKGKQEKKGGIQAETGTETEESEVRLPVEAKLRRGSSETDENNEDFSVRKDLQNLTSVIKI